MCVRVMCVCVRACEYVCVMCACVRASVCGLSVVCLWFVCGLSVCVCVCVAVAQGNGVGHAACFLL